MKGSSKKELWQTKLRLLRPNVNLNQEDNEYKVEEQEKLSHGNN